MAWLRRTAVRVNVLALIGTGYLVVGTFGHTRLPSYAASAIGGGQYQVALLQGVYGKSLVARSPRA